MKLSLFDYHLPKKLIAQKPLKSRDQAGLMVLDRKKKTIAHHKFFELPKFLRPGDVLVFNDTKVFAARLIGKRETGGKIEVFLLKPVKGKTWQVLLGGKRRRHGLVINFKQGLSGKIIEKMPDNTWLVQFNCGSKELLKKVDKIGQAPTPPYIKRKSNLKEYQTIYAKHLGSVAAPTAGFHFTKKLMSQIKKQGVQIEFVTLHVGLGTFEPVRSEKIENHKMHAEYAMINKSTATRINKAKKEGHRIIAVGTTTLRALESFSAKNGQLLTVNCQKSTNIFIYPGYKFKLVDGLITNFHLPKSTLLMLVSALAGRQFIKKSYKIAIRKKYRFYSFGDGMMIY